jgi:hypothetical protein
VIQAMLVFQKSIQAMLVLWEQPPEWVLKAAPKRWLLQAAGTSQLHEATLVDALVTSDYNRLDYFCLPKGKCPRKDGRMARPNGNGAVKIEEVLLHL